LLPYPAEAALGENGDLEGFHPGRFDGWATWAAGIASSRLLAFGRGSKYMVRKK
jgi:hypothetical protein